ncbi:MAG: hypothetical protein R3F30_04300 [Planctomycetota bacterium]
MPVPVTLLPAVLCLLVQDGEHARALANETWVPTADPILTRRIQAGLDRLDEGKGRQAMIELLPVLAEPDREVAIAYGARETRSFWHLLDRRLAEATPSLRAAFAEGLEVEAGRVLELLPMRPRALRSFCRRYPGTDAAASARRKLALLMLEQGDRAGLGECLLGLGRDAELEAARDRLRAAEAARHPWPQVRGGPDGLPAQVTVAWPERPAPRLAAELEGRWSLLGPYARGVVGRHPTLGEFALFQDPVQVALVFASPAAGKARCIELEPLCGLPPGEPEPPEPALAGDRAFVVHGDAEEGTALLALTITPGPPAVLAPAWTWKPTELPTGEGQSPRARLRPRVLASGGRVWVTLVDVQDRLSAVVKLCCLAADGDGAGGPRLLWSTLLAKGAPLSSDIVTSRQEEVRAKAVQPAAPILHRGLVLADTGLGVLVAVGAASGEQLWSFRSARLQNSGQEGWLEARVEAHGDEVLYAPGDGDHLYRLSVGGGTGELLRQEPCPKRSLSRLLGVAGDAAYFLRGEAMPGEVPLQDIRPVRLRLDRDLERFDAPPLEPDQRPDGGPLLTGHDLLLSTARRLYHLDLDRDLAYAHVIELPSAHPLGLAGPVLPFAGGLLLGSSAGPLTLR